MNHAEVKSYLADYLEGDLALDARALVDAHLDACTDCAEEVDQMQHTIRLLRMLPDPEPPPMIAANVMRRIRAGETEPSFLGRIRRALDPILEPGFVLPASAVAAAALVVVAIQDPSSLSRLGFSLDSPANETAVVTAESLGISPRSAAEPSSKSFPESLVAGLESESGRVFGAPTAQNFGFTVTPRDADSRVATAQPRFRIELQPAAPRGSVLYSDPSLAPRLPDVFVAQPSAGLEGRLNGVDRWGAYPGRSGSSSYSGASGAIGDRVALPAAQPRSVRPGGSAVFGESSGGEDKRDEWLARGLEDPRGFARYIASQNLAEQELWVSRLTERAEARGLLSELVQGLQSSGDAMASVIAEDFVAESVRLRDGGNADALPR